MSESESDLADSIDIDDYKKIQHVFLVRNDTSQTTIVDPEAVKLISIRPDGIMLKMPRNSCQKNQKLAVFIFESPMKDPITSIPLEGTIKGACECLGRITKFEKCHETGEIGIFLEFTQVDEKKWSKMVEQYRRVEEKIENLNEAGRMD